MFDFCRDDRMHSLLIISLFNLDLWALVFQSTWSIRIEVSLKCVREYGGGGIDCCLKGGMAIHIYIIFTLGHTIQSETEED